MNCKDCKFLKAISPRNGGIRCTFQCSHKDQAYIYEYHKAHNLTKFPPFVCYGGGLYGTEPTIKTSPAWCPFKRKEKGEKGT